MRQKRSSPAVINHQGSVYVFGGRKAFSCWMIECEMFSRENNIWIPLKSLAKAP